MVDESARPDDMPMLKSISEKEREVEAMIAEAHEKAESKIKEARQRAARIAEGAKSRGLEEKRVKREKTLEAVREEVRRKEQEYEEILKGMAEEAKARIPQAVEGVIGVILPH